MKERKKYFLLLLLEYMMIFCKYIINYINIEIFNCVSFKYRVS